MLDADILNYLYDNHCAEYIDITDFMFGKFPSQGKSVYDHIIETINSLTHQKLIRLDNPYFVDLGSMITTPGYSQTAKEKLTFELFKQLGRTIPAKITLQGKELVRQWRFNDQIERTNKAIEESSKSSIKTNESINKLNEVTMPRSINNQERLGRLTLRVAGISVLISVAAVYVAHKGVTSEDIGSLRLQLQKTSQSLDSIRQYQKGIDASLRTVARDSVKKIYVLKK